MQEAEDGSASPRTPVPTDVRARSRLGAGVATFELAAVRLASAGRREGGGWRLDALAPESAPPPDEEAGRALVALGALVERCRAQSAGEMEAATLGRLLRPDPARVSTSWSVECYRIGDFAPHTLRDHTSPTSAIEALVDCGDRDHVAARLIATSGGGLSWVALVRTGTRVAFQLFGRDTVILRHGVGRPDAHGPFEEALAHWGRRLAHWHREQGKSGPFFVARCARQLSGEKDDVSEVPREAGETPREGAESAGAGVGDSRETALDLVGDADGAPSAAELFFEVAASLERLSEKMERVTRALHRLEREVAGEARTPGGVASSESTNGVVESSRSTAGVRAVPPPIEGARLVARNLVESAPGDDAPGDGARGDDTKGEGSPGDARPEGGGSGAVGKRTSRHRASRGRNVTEDPWTEAR